MCAMASSSESTMRMAITLSRYSAFQSASVALSHGMPGISACARASAFIFTPATCSAPATAGSAFAAASLCTSSVSAALHAAGYWVFASTVTRAAIRTSHAASR